MVTDCAPCDDDCKLVEDACFQAPGELPFTFDLFDICAAIRQANVDYTTGQRVRPTVPNGYALEALNNGTTGNLMPTFKPILGTEFWDGSVQWRVIAAGVNGISAATSPSASVDPADSGSLSVAGLTIVDNRFLHGYYIPGEADTVYEVTFTFTLSARTRSFRQRVTVT